MGRSPGTEHRILPPPCPTNCHENETTDGNLAKNDKEKADIFDPHFQRIFNRDTPHVDIPAILNRIPKKTTMSKLGDPPTKTEFDTAIRNMANEKKPRQIQNPCRTAQGTFRRQERDSPQDPRQMLQRRT
jgi:hypothetical protein